MKKLGKSTKKGFTLVELIVVLVILAILAAMLVPALVGYIDRAKKEKEYQAASTVYAAVQALATETYGKGGELGKASDKSTFNLKEVTDLTGITVNDIKYNVKSTASTATNIEKYTIQTVAIQFNKNEDYYTYTAGGNWGTAKPDDATGTSMLPGDSDTSDTSGT